jgi:hypothetical protein
MLDSIYHAENIEIDVDNKGNKKIKILIREDGEVLEKDLDIDILSGAEEELIWIDTLEDSNHVIIKKKMLPDIELPEVPDVPVPPAPIHIEVITDDEGNVTTYSFVSPEIDEEIIREMENAKIEIKIAEKEIKMAQKEAKEARKEVELAHREAAKAMKEAKKAHGEMEYEYKYIMEYPDPDVQVHFEHHPEMSLEEKEEILEEELERLEKELKEVKKKIKKEKRKK